MSAVTLVRLARVDSTQAFLERHPELGVCAVLAGAQTAGRGQRDNRWESAPGAGLWLSARIPAPDLPPGLVLQRAMAGVAEALEPWGVPLGLKWPNDLVAWLDNRLVKLGGILGRSKGDCALLGVGVNLGSAPVIPERPIPPACLADLLPRGAALPDPEPLAQAILEAWEDLDVHREPAFLWPGPGDPIRWEEGEGVCAGWLEDGRLEVRTAQGVLQLVAGDVSGLKA
ncbi:MAG: biotin--[acetyl-CoA-carboxylase] ligase [Holophaga sp.]|jgi:BirA family biotin operon repressor/biotin-[acetyl-CoA-carboxylase] ligase